MHTRSNCKSLVRGGGKVGESGDNLKSPWTRVGHDVTQAIGCPADMQVLSRDMQAGSLAYPEFFYWKRGLVSQVLFIAIGLQYAISLFVVTLKTIFGHSKGSKIYDLNLTFRYDCNIIRDNLILRILSSQTMRKIAITGTAIRNSSREWLK